MQMTKHSVKLLILLILQIAISSTFAQDFTDAGRIEDWRFSRIARSDSGIRSRLPVTVRSLQDNSRLPVQAVLDRNLNIISAGFEIAPRVRSRSASAEEIARAFLRDNLSALAPHVLESELRLKSMPYSCDVAPTQGSKPGKTLIFERFVNNLPVIGGSIMIRVEGTGFVTSVYNSLAPLTTLISRVAASTGAESLLSIAKIPRSSLRTVACKRKDREAIIRRGKPVWIPIRFSGSRGLLQRALHITWATSNHQIMSGFLLPDKTVLAPTIVPATQRDKAIPLAYIDQRTQLPTFISYRSRGGLAVSAVGVFDNPAEIAYRYLEEHPDVFRTGAARCQFEVIDIRKSASDSRTSFVKLGQVMAGRPVFGADLVFEIENGNRVQTVQGHTIARLVRLEPQISSERAHTTAALLLDAAFANASPNLRERARQMPIANTLVVFPGDLVAQKGLGKDRPTRLAYHTESLLYGLFIDAIGGEILYGYSRLQGANVIYEAAGKTILEKLFFAEVSRDGVPSTPGTPLTPDAAAAVPLVAATDAFYRAHGWIGTNGSGSDLAANVNVNLFTCPNAFSPPINEQSYFCTGEVVPDIVAHELTHGVIWNSSNMIYVDEPGALNESYADIIGNLAFPDVVPLGSPPGTLPGWLVGEGSVGAATTLRNMANPALSTPVPQPGNYAGYLSRNALGCSLFDLPGLGCDFGGVHLNSGIVSRAHVLMSDGGLGGLVGMGRAKIRMLAFDVMTLRLSQWSRMVDSAIATKASCDALLARGGTDLTGAPFTQLDCDQIPGAFATVGLDPDLISDWIPPTVGFTGTQPQFTGETTDNSCVITDLILRMTTPAGQLDSKASVVGPGVALTTSYFGLITGTIGTTAPPIGTTSKAHTITWSSVFGESPQLGSDTPAPPPPGTSNCRGALVTERQVSAPAVSTGIPFLGGASTTPTGNAASTMNTGCVLVRTEVEMIDSSGTVIASAATAPTWSNVVWITFVPVTLRRTLTIGAQPIGATPGGPGTFNLAAPVTWTYSLGLPDVRWRLVYTIDKPAGLTCTP
jgi:Zn-dependent metalloprotease